eukprot:s209_g22.t1
MDERGRERPDCAMLDPGASAFLSGYGPFKRYIDKLVELGYDIKQLEFQRCSRTFHFRGDASSECKWTVKLPIFLAGKFGFVQMYLLKGETPMLMGRPIMENLGLILDCRNKCIKLDGTSWQSAVVGAHGEYLLPLTKDYDEALLNHQPSFELLVPADGNEPITNFHDFNNSENLFQCEPIEAACQDGERPLRRHHLCTCETKLNELENQLHAYVTSELHEPDQVRPRVLWEVYCGEARVAKIAESMGMIVECFGPDTGWDFDDPEHQRLFLERQRAEMPDEVYISPDCRLWSQMQNLAARSEDQKLNLYHNRMEHHKVHLKFVAQIYLEQVDNARHAHIEQPEHALSWKTTALKDLPGYFTIFHQCMFGSCCPDFDGIWKHVKKATALLTSKVTMSIAMNKLCDGQHLHCALEGSAAGYGRRTTYMENYQPGLAATLASAIFAPDPPQMWEHAMAVPEQKEVTGKLIQLQTHLKTDAVRTVQRLHRNLGHPSPEALVELLQSRGASEAVIEAAKTYRCAACIRYKKPNSASPATLRQQATELGECIQADILWLRIGANKFAVLSVVDMATKYQVASLLKSEKGPDLIKGLERCWIKHFGVPAKMISDEGRGWCGTDMSTWTTENGVDHEVAPGEAHTRLALVERRHAILRKAVEIYLDDRKLTDHSGVRQALTYVLPQINSTNNVAGFSPTQWVLGKQVQLPGELSGERLSPGQLDGYNFEAVLQNRAAAKSALAQAEADAKLRRALLRQYQGTNFPLEVGQLCHFWRDQREDKLVKIRWHGPARVVMREDDEAGAPHTYWLAWKTQLIKCAPHHVRADLASMSHQLADAQAAKREVAALRSRGVTRFLDLERINRQNLDDVDDDEQDMSDGDGDGDDLQPPRQRRRVDVQVLQLRAPGGAPQAPGALQAPQLPALPEVPGSPAYSPGTPMDDRDATLADLDENAPLPDQQHDEPHEVPIPIDADELEPGQEPSIPPTPAAMQQHPQQDVPTLDPETAALYEPAANEDFRGMRRRFDAQEGSLFGPSRRRFLRPAPYSEPDRSPVRPPPPEDPQQAPEQALFNHAFTVTDMDQAELPKGWHVDEHGYLQLDISRMDDYWEVKAGCLIRHHLRPRRLLHEFSPGADCPVTAEMLDPIRVTMMKMPNGTTNVLTDNMHNKEKPMSPTWTGITVYQLNGKSRKEYAMTATALPAKKVARQFKHMTKKVAKKPAELSERNMTLWEKEQFMAAKTKELKSFFEHGVWEFSHEKDADPTRTLTSRMLLKWSRNADGTPRAKARLIVRGYADRDALEGRVETSAPTTSRLSRSMFLSLSSCLRWSGWTADVSTAFLQGVPQSRKLWVKLPADALAILGCSDPGVRMYLHKPIYGQLDAPRRWFLEASRRLLNLGFRVHPLDPCTFLLYEQDFPEGREHPAPQDQLLGPHGLCAMVCIHVDDMLGGGSPNSKVYQLKEAELKKAFSFREWQTSANLEYCGASLEKTPTGGWSLHHDPFIKKIKPIALARGRAADDSLSPSEVSQLRALLGSLQWPAVQSQPHLQASTSLLASKMTNGTVNVVQEANKLLRFSKLNSDVKLQYEYLGEVADLRLVCQFDAAFGVRRDSSSQGGWITMLIHKDAFEGQECPYHVLDWKSSKLPRVTRSSLGAEAQSAGQAADSIEFVCRYWECLKDPNASLAEILERPCSLSPTLVSSERQFADGLTKDSTRQLLADRLRHHKVKFTWDPTYQAAKKKEVNERNQSRDEFSKTREKIHEDLIENDPNDDMGMDETHHVESYGFMEDPVDYIMVDEETNFSELSEPYIPEYDIALTNANVMNGDSAQGMSHSNGLLQALIAFCCLLCGRADNLPALNFEPMDQCPVQIYEPTTPETLDSGYYLLDLIYVHGADFLVYFAFLAFVLIAYKAALVFGWWQGRNFMVFQRHIRARRLERELEEKTVEAAELQNRLDELETTLAQSEPDLRRALLHKEAECRNLGRQVQLLEDSFFHRQEQLRRMEQTQHRLQATMVRYERLRSQGRNVVRRAYNEVVQHFMRYHHTSNVHVAARGAVWHQLGDCYQLHNSQVRTLFPCQMCACETVTPYIVDGSGTTLQQDLNSWLVNAEFFDSTEIDDIMFPQTGGASASATGAG